MFKTIAILGSCVTRDAFSPELTPGVRVALYVARTSFLSLAAAPVEIAEEDIAVEGKFERRQLHQDLAKTGLAAMATLRPELLLIDLIDERFDLLLRGAQIVTRSNYLVNAGLEASPLLAGFERVKRNLAATHALWADAAAVLMPQLRELAGRVVVHRALYAESKYLPDGSVEPFEPAEAKIARAANAWMERYYDRLMALGADDEICVPAELRVSDFAHKWGRDFFHYGQPYYRNLAAQIAALDHSQPGVAMFQ